MLLHTSPFLSALHFNSTERVYYCLCLLVPWIMLRFSWDHGCVHLSVSRGVNEEASHDHSHRFLEGYIHWGELSSKRWRLSLERKPNAGRDTKLSANSTWERYTKEQLSHMMAVMLLLLDFQDQILASRWLSCCTSKLSYIPRELWFECLPLLKVTMELNYLGNVFCLFVCLIIFKFLRGISQWEQSSLMD